jgi:four helix bundle protein
MRSSKCIKSWICQLCMQNSKTTYAFQDWSVYSLSKDVVKSVYQMTSVFPKDETFGLSNQMRRAAVSITSNIAEGSGRDSEKMKIQFYGYAYSSVLEVFCQLDIANDLNYIRDQSAFVHLQNKLKVLSYRIYQLKQPLSK